MAKVVTSVSIDEDIWKAARKFAIDKGITVSELLDLSLRTFMTSPQEGQLQRASASVAEVRSEAARKAWNTRRSQRKTGLSHTARNGAKWLQRRGKPERRERNSDVSS